MVYTLVVANGSSHHLAQVIEGSRLREKAADLLTAGKLGI